MTTFAPTFTPRYKLHYKVGGIEHTVTIRGPRGEDPTGIGTRGNTINSIFSTLADKLMDDFTLQFAEYALTDSDVFLPAGLPSAAVGTVDVATMTLKQRITGTTFAGKGSAGRSRFTLFGIVWPIDLTTGAGNDYVVLGSEDADIASVVTSASSQFYTNGGVPATFHNQATIKEWDDLVKKARRGIIS